MKAKKKRKYAFTVIILGPVNKHYNYVKDSMAHIHEILGRTESINVKPKDLYRLKAGLLTRLRYKIRGIDSGFLAVFGEGSEEPISYDAPKYSARVLKEISESRALKTALKDEFAKAMDTKALFMYFLLIAGAIVIYLFMTGQLSV